MELRTIKRIVMGVGIAVALLVVWTSFTETVSQGHVGVVFNKAKGGVQDRPLNEGLHFVNPLSKITEYPVSTETVKYKLSLPTGDTKTIVIPVSFDYHNERAKAPAIYREWRGQQAEDLESGYLRRNLLSIASEVTSQYTILELNANRGKIQTEILKEFTARVEDKGFLVASINLGTPQYDKETKRAIQQVVNAQQALEKLKIDKQKAQIEAERVKIIADGEAQAKIAEAKGQAESIKIKAKAQADANKQLNASLTPNVLKMEELKARQAHGWVEIQGATPLVQAK